VVEVLLLSHWEAQRGDLIYTTGHWQNWIPVQTGWPPMHTPNVVLKGNDAHWFWTIGEGVSILGDQKMTKVTYMDAEITWDRGRAW
jgi:hypothetical protein